MASTTSPGSSSTVSPILSLPHELLFEIVSDIDDTEDLRSLARTCKNLNSHVIPEHIEYRILNVRTFHPVIFAHLARRTDLAQNIREVHISEKHNYTRGDRMPQRLVDMALDGNPKLNGSADERVKAINVCKALRSMSKLRSFTWEWNGCIYKDATGQRREIKPTGETRFEDAILAEVCRKSTLERFGLNGPFGSHVDGPSFDNKYQYPVWHLSNLTHLELFNHTWLKPANVLPLCIMLSRCPELECLTIPLEFKHLSVVGFPKLKKAKLELVSGATSSVDPAAVAFIENHPGLEELSWYPLSNPRFRKGTLPNLKRLRSNGGVFTALLEADSRVEEGCQVPAGQPVSVAVVSPPPAPAPATSLTVGAGKRSKKRLTMIQEADAEEDGSGGRGEDSDDGGATPGPSARFELISEDHETLPGSSSSTASEEGTAQYVTVPAITVSAPPTTPTSLATNQEGLRPFESLDVISLTASTLLSLAPSGMDRNALRHLSLDMFGDIQEMYDLADMFPNIRWLNLPPRYYPPLPREPVKLTIDDILAIVPRFTHLEILKGCALWSAVGEDTENGKQRVHDAIGSLVQLCPKLREVSHNEWYDKRKGFMRVVVERRLVTVPRGATTFSGSVEEGPEMEEVEVASYGIRKPFFKKFFDVVGGVWDSSF